MNRRSRSVLVSCALLLATQACSAPLEPVAPGTYPTAGAGDLSGTVCTFRTGSHKSDSFSWSFDNGTFAIRGDAIPATALSVLGLADTGAHSIDGTWSLDGQSVLLQVTTVDKQRANAPSVAIPMMRTGPKILRLVIAGDQFVFHG